MAGWIYVMSNPAMPGLLKIGCSSKEPKRDRVHELSRETGVPLPFRVEYQALVENERGDEGVLHRHFANRRVPGKEFFKDVAIDEVIAVAKRLCQIKYEDDFSEPVAKQSGPHYGEKRWAERKEEELTRASVQRRTYKDSAGFVSPTEERSERPNQELERKNPPDPLAIQIFKEVLKWVWWAVIVFSGFALMKWLNGYW